LTEEKTIEERILEVLADGKEHVLGEIAEKVGVEPYKVRYRLMKLALDGKIVRRVITPRVFLWRIKKRRSQKKSESP